MSRVCPRDSLKRSHAVPAEMPLASEERSDLIFLERTSRLEVLEVHRSLLPNEQSKSAKTELQESMLRTELESESESSFRSHSITGKAFTSSSSKFKLKKS
mmetsp:Transcript_7132/g.16121  ORF Transcript_7132/g.16121 Transcript_7132/m.16121 type:complete len:101 (-) Transcript_7132:252-554(-)